MTNNSQTLVKRFVAPTMTRALELVQRELGPEAVILSSRRVEKGIEIVTSLEPDLPTRGIDVRRTFGQNFDAELDRALPSDSAWRSQAGIEKAAAEFGGHSELNTASQRQKAPSELAKEIELARERMLAAKRRAKEEAEGYAKPRVDNRYAAQPGEQPTHNARRQVYESAPQPQVQPRTQVPHAQVVDRTDDGSHYAPSIANPSYPENSYPPTSYLENSERSRPNTHESLEKEAQLEQLQNDIADMRLLLEQQLWRMNETRQSSNFTMPQQVTMPNTSALIKERLGMLGLKDRLTDELVAQCDPGARASVAWRACMGHLSKRIPVCDHAILDTPGIYAFLGQTGVGKTTSIAKLAAQYVLKHGAGKVALVTTDTFRVGAFDQLRTMGRILNVPVRIVDGDNSLLTVLASLRQFPLILIDTAGFRLGDPLLKAQLDQVEKSNAIKRVLVISCNSQFATMKASVHAHRGKRGLHSCVLTKLDESATIGEAMSLVVEENLPVSYLSDGQNIPKDINRASGHGLVSKAVSLAREMTPNSQERTAQ